MSETGPPHNKTFTWSLKMGDMTTMGSGNTKKGAKNKAAEEMARKLDKLPRPGRFNGRPRGGAGVGGFGFRGGFVAAAPFPPGPQFVPGQWPLPPHFAKKRKISETGLNSAPETPDAKVANTVPAASTDLVAKLNSPTSNPISKLYEYSKQKKLPEPIYETLAENVIDRKKTNKGFTLKKTEFTIQVEILGKKFVGVAMTKKQAKYNASAAAWADLSGLPAPGAGIESMLREARNSASASQAQQ